MKMENRMENPYENRQELACIALLLLATVYAMCAYHLGTSYLVGAFMAGVSLAPESPEQKAQELTDVTENGKDDRFARFEHHLHRGLALYFNGAVGWC